MLIIKAFLISYYEDIFPTNAAPCRYLSLRPPTYRVWHRFRLTKQTDYFGVNFDHFWIEQYFWRPLGQYWKLAPALNRTTIEKFSLPKFVKRYVALILLFTGLSTTTDDQLFFIGFARAYCSSSRRKALDLTLLLDSHSPNQVRVNTAVSNFDEFSRAWNCHANSPLNLPSSQRCSLWWWK